MAGPMRRGDEFFLLDSSSEAVAEVLLGGDALGFHRGFQFALASKRPTRRRRRSLISSSADGEWRVLGLDLEAQQFVVDEFIERGLAGEFEFGGVRLAADFPWSQSCSLTARSSWLRVIGWPATRATRWLRCRDSVRGTSRRVMAEIRSSASFRQKSAIAVRTMNGVFLSDCSWSFAATGDRRY